MDCGYFFTRQIEIINLDLIMGAILPGSDRSGVGKPSGGDLTACWNVLGRTNPRPQEILRLFKQIYPFWPGSQPAAAAVARTLRRASRWMLIPSTVAKNDARFLP